MSVSSHQSKRNGNMHATEPASPCAPAGKCLHCGSVQDLRSGALQHGDTSNHTCLRAKDKLIHAATHDELLPRLQRILRSWHADEQITQLNRRFDSGLNCETLWCACDGRSDNDEEAWSLHSI